MRSLLLLARRSARRRQFSLLPSPSHLHFRQGGQCICFSSTTTTVKPTENFLQLWNRQVEEGKLRPDKAQQKVAKRLHRLQTALLDGYSNQPFFQQLQEQSDEEESSKEEQESSEQEDTIDKQESKNEGGKKDKTHPHLPRIPRGLYIHGPVGTGKSLLMDTFYKSFQQQQQQTTTTTTKSKSRYHFHEFMAMVHEQIHALQQHDLRTKGRNFAIDTSYHRNPIVRVALQLAQSTPLLCLDEFQVTDVADAMILQLLLEVLLTHGTVLVATSNRPPSLLYEDGLNRSYFLPCIDLLQQYCIVHSLESNVGDYRKWLVENNNTDNNDHHTKNDHQTTNANSRLKLLPPNHTGSFFLKHDPEMVDSIVANTATVLNNNGDNSLHSFDLPVGFGRTLTVTRGIHHLVGIFDFEQLCDTDVGASDYRAIARHFAIVVVQNVPPLSTYHHNRARRFITLVDELYEGKCALLCSTTTAQTTPDDLFETPATSVISSNDTTSTDDVVQEALGLEDVQTQGGQPVSTLASVRELAFAFQRAASRITEMTSTRWWNQELTQVTTAS